MIPSWDTIAAGAEPGSRTVGPISRTDIVRYQGASGDMNPIHHDEPFAREAGYDAPLVVGMYPAGVLTTWATDWLGAENVRSLRLRWTRQVWPGDTLTHHGEVLETRAEGLEVDLELTATNQDGEPVVKAWMTFAMPSR